MITFRPLTPDEYAAYMVLGGHEYAEDLAANYRLAPGRAAVESDLTASQELPQGQETPGNRLLAIATPDAPLIGYLWFSETSETQSAYVKDFLILPAHRGKGHGTASLAALETLLKAKGITQIRLRVAANNPRAKALYEATGFFTTGTSMAKSI
jgi:ribosomal protein S18 acetylase RimI-like enzyme